VSVATSAKRNCSTRDANKARKNYANSRVAHAIEKFRFSILAVSLAGDAMLKKRTFEQKIGNHALVRSWL
jgi:hypothetical protein